MFFDAYYDALFQTKDREALGHHDIDSIPPLTPMQKDTIKHNIIKKQLLMIIPILTLVFVLSFYTIIKTFTERITQTSNISLHQIDNMLDTSLRQSIKSLEAPYASQEMMDILRQDPSTYIDDAWANQTDTIQMNQQLRYRILNANISISNVSLIPANREEVYRSALDITAANAITYTDAIASEWYQKALSQQSYFLHIDKSCDDCKDLSVIQRINDPITQDTLGVLKLDVDMKQLESFAINALINPDDFIIIGIGDENLQYSLVDWEIVKVPNTADFFVITEFEGTYPGFYFSYITNYSKMFTVLAVQSLILLTGFILLIYIVMRNITKVTDSIASPVLSLKNDMREAMDGDLSVRSPQLEGEFQELSDAFNSLMEQLEIQVEDIRQAEIDKSALRYEILLTKVNPHFLYNTLNAIKWKAESISAYELAGSIEALVNYLKSILRNDSSTNTVAEELELLESYIKIMRLRYSDEVDIDYDIDEETFDIEIMKFILQPLIENAYIHAFSDDKTDQVIQISIMKHDQEMIIKVRDNGKGVPTTNLETLTSKRNSSSTQVGLNNLNQRLIQHYGEVAALTIESDGQSYTQFEIHIPLEEA